MSAAGVLLERPEDLAVAAPAPAPAVAEERVDRELLVILSVAIAVAFTFTVTVIGSILIALALRDSGVMGSLWGKLLQFTC